MRSSSRRLLSTKSRRRGGNVVRREERFSFPNQENRRLLPKSFGESGARGIAQIEKKLAALKKYDPQLPEDVTISFEKPGTRYLTMKDWDAFDAPSFVGDMSKAMKTWDRHGGVLTVVLDGKFGSVDADDAKTLDEIYEMYKTIRFMKTPVIGMLDDVVTPGGVGLLGPRATATTDGVLTPILSEGTLAELPRFIDGGIGFLLSRTGKYGRCAALSGLPVRGNSLKLSGIVKTVLSNVAFADLYEEIFHFADNGDVDLISHHIDSVLEMMTVSGSVYVEQDEPEFKTLAELCFEPQTVDKIKESLQAAATSSSNINTAQCAEHALETLNQFPNHAKLLSTFLHKCAKLTYRECLDLELAVNKNLLTSPLQQYDFFTSTDIEAYFKLPTASKEEKQLGF